MKRFLALFTAALLWGQSSLADTIDFTGLGAGDLGTIASAGGVTFESKTNLANKSDQYFQNAGGAICASRGSGSNCKGNMTINFNGKVNRLSFSSADYQPGDGVSIVVYRGRNVIGSTGFSWNGKVNLGIYKRVTKIKLSYTGVENGMAIGKFDFTRVAARQNRQETRRAARTDQARTD